MHARLDRPERRGAQQCKCHPDILTLLYLGKTAVLARVLRPYAIHVFRPQSMSRSPLGPPTADPLDLYLAHIGGIDTLARVLLAAADIVTERQLAP